MSLRLRLTLLNGLVLLLAVVAFAGVAYVTQKQALESSLDASLQQQALWYGDNSSLWFDRARGRPRGVSFPNPQRFSAPDVFVQITLRDGDIGGRSANLNDVSLPGSLDMLRRALDGESWFTEVDVDGEPLRMFVAPLRVGPSGDGQPVGMIQVARPLAAVYNSLGLLQTTLLIAGAVSTLAALAVGWMLARAALRPIDRLAATAQAIGHSQDFGRRVPLGPEQRRDEVGCLAEEFNHMLARLQAAYAQLEAALAAQRRFVADASHELRTPLTSLRGNVELLRRRALSQADSDPEDQHQMLADMAAETERLGRLVGDLLLLARADAGQHLVLESTELGAVVREAFRSARFLREGVELRLGEIGSDMWVTADADRLKQLLLILLDNALKYTPEGGRVAIAAQPLARDGRAGVAVSVSDTGPGITADEQERIFERFYRVDRARGSGGAGLGLAIAHWIADEHHGGISLESAPGRGSVFTLWMPSIPPPESPASEHAAAPVRSPAPAI